MWRFDLAKECFEKAGDLSALMLLLMAMGDRDGFETVGRENWCVFPFCFSLQCADGMVFL